MKDVKEQKQNDNGEIIEMKQGQVIKIPKNSGKASKYSTQNLKIKVVFRHIL